MTHAHCSRVEWTIFGTGLLAVAIALAIPLIVTTAQAAQPYSCICDGVKKRFLASTRMCEKQANVKSCSAAQFAAFNKRACKANGCKAP